MFKQLKILQIGADELTNQSREISPKELSTSDMQTLIDNMIYTCELGKDHTAGLAAAQIGKNIQLTVIRKTDIEQEKEYSEELSVTAIENSEQQLDEIDVKKLDWEALINPKIVSSSDENSVIWEACLSIGEGPKQVWGPVSRPDSVEVEYLDRNGKIKNLQLTGFMSHLAQHEIDHLNGILFLQHVPNPAENLWLSEDLDDYMEKHDGFPPVR